MPDQVDDTPNLRTPEHRTQKRRPVWPWLVLLLLAPIALQRVVPVPAVDLPIEPLELDEALDRAAQADQPVLLSVFATWCSACRLLDGEVLSDPAVEAAIRHGYVFARLDIDSETGGAFARSHGVTGVPALLVLDAQGRVERQLVPSFDPHHLAAELRQASVAFSSHRDADAETCSTC